MATIRARKRADGSMSYTAQIRLKKNGQQVHTESMTFSRKKRPKRGLSDEKRS